MKTLITTAFLLLASFYVLDAQSIFYHFSIYAGMSPAQSPNQAGLICNRETPMDEFVFNLEKIEMKYMIGLKTNFQFSYPFFVTLGLEYSSQSEHYTCAFTHTGFREDDTSGLTYTHRTITLPAGVGVRFNHFDFTSGANLQYNIMSGMTVEQPMEIELSKPRMEMGWYSGVGFSFGRTRIGVEYQSTMNRYGHDLEMKHKSMELMSVPGNVRFTVAFSF